MTSEQCINIIKNRLIALVDSGQLKATYKPSNRTISFYVNDIDMGERPLLTLRLSDHNPEYWSYVQQGLTPPYEGDGVNVSIEFYKPKIVNGRKLRNRVDTRVKVPPMVNGVVQFVVNSYDYTPEKLEEKDIDLIYDAILSWINGGYGAKYIDPFAKTSKKAKVQSKNANITWNIAHNISVDSSGNYVSANGWGADFVSENKRLNNNRNMNKKLIRLTEADLHMIVKESIHILLRESENNIVYNPNNLHIVPTTTNVNTQNSSAYGIPYDAELYKEVCLENGYVQLSDGKFYQKGYGMDEDGTVIDVRELCPLESDAMAKEYINQEYMSKMGSDVRFADQYRKHEQEHSLDYERQELEREKIEAERRKYANMYKPKPQLYNYYTK